MQKDDSGSLIRDPPHKSHVPQSKAFIAVAQVDQPMHLEVLDWLKTDPQYRTLYILHDRDSYSDGDTIPEDKKVGDLKPPHYHIFVLAPRKIAAHTMTKRFGCYLHFLLCADPFEQIRYMTHSTFLSRDKFHYSLSDLKGDITLLDDFNAHPDILDVCSRIVEYSNSCSRQDAVRSILIEGDKQALYSLMSHSHFYDKFVFRKD